MEYVIYIFKKLNKCLCAQFQLSLNLRVTFRFTFWQYQCIIFPNIPTPTLLLLYLKIIYDWGDTFYKDFKYPYGEFQEITL